MKKLGTMINAMCYSENNIDYGIFFKYCVMHHLVRIVVRASAAWKEVLLDPGDLMKSLPRHIQVKRQRYWYSNILLSNYIHEA